MLWNLANMSILIRKHNPRMNGEIGNRNSPNILCEADLPDHIPEETIFNAERGLKGIVIQDLNARVVGAGLAVDLD